MKIFSYCSESHALLKESFLKSFHATHVSQSSNKLLSFPLSSSKIQAENMSAEVCDMHQIREWEEAEKNYEHVGGGVDGWLFKVKLVVDLIKKNFDEVIIVSDADIRFKQSIEEEIKKLIIGYDMLFQTDLLDEKTVNIGFVVIRCNQRTLEFWERVFEIVAKKQVWDQGVVNSRLSKITVKKLKHGKGFETKCGMKWARLPLTYLAWHVVYIDDTLVSLKKFLRVLFLNLNQVRIIHATEVGGLSNPQRKLELFEEFEKAKRYPWKFRMQYCINFLTGLKKRKEKIKS